MKQITVTVMLQVMIADTVDPMKLTPWVLKDMAINTLKQESPYGPAVHFLVMSEGDASAVQTDQG